MQPHGRLTDIPWHLCRWTAGGQTPLEGASRGGTGQPVTCALIRKNVSRQHDEVLRNRIAHGLVMRRSGAQMQGPGYLVCALRVLDPRDFQLCQSDFRGGFRRANGGARDSAE